MIKTGLNKRITNLEVSIRNIDRRKRNVLSTLAEIIPAVEAGIEFKVAPEVEEAFKRIEERTRSKDSK